MHSSTLTSKLRRQMGWVAGLSLVTLGIAAWFSICVEPGTVEWRSIMNHKRACAERISRESTNKVVFVGGSSTSFGVMPSVLKERYGIHAVNAGLHAGCGSGFLVLWACTLLNPGDTLVILIEPGLFRDPLKQPQSQTLMEIGMPPTYWDLKKDLFNDHPLAVTPKLQSLRPGGVRLTKLIAAMLRGFVLTGYRTENVDAYGTLTAVQLPPDQLKPNDVTHLNSNLDPALTSDGAYLLHWIREFCARKKVKVCYIYPRIWVTPESLEAYSERTGLLSAEISRYIPVVGNNDFAITQGDLFLDSVLHLNPAGAAWFSEKIGEALIAEELATGTLNNR